MKKPQKNYAFIDSQNVNLAVRNLGWQLDWKKFRVYLTEHYGVKKAYLFLGYLPQNQDLYSSLQSAGFILIFKPILEYSDGTVKGNCDAELVLQTMIDWSEYKQAIIVTGDGDFYCLIDWLHKHAKLAMLLVPNQFKYSALFKKTARQKITFMNNLIKKLAYRPKKLQPDNKIPPTKTKSTKKKKRTPNRQNH